MNAVPSLSGALWNGNQQLATKTQLISSISGLYTDLQDLSGFQFQNLDVSTLNVKNWISTPELYVSSLYARNIDLSGITLDPSGIFIVTDVSGNYSQFNFQLMSSMSFKFDPTLQVQINVGDATLGFLTGLGALVFQTLLGIGVGAGAAFQGIGNGIAAMIMANGSQNTYINQNNFELIGGSTQLQVSTLGTAYPTYSSIMRYVSSVSPNQVPGQPEFISTLFYPGQICIRSISDPFPILSQDPNITTSTIQQFGEWVPLIGLEPENIIANSISTNLLSTGQFFAETAYITTQQGYSALFSNAGFAQSASLNYQAPLQFQLGANTNASFVGDLNRLYCYNNGGYIFNGSGGTTEMASLYLGTNAEESILNVSSIFSRGLIQTSNIIASTITADSLNVLSTFFIESVNQQVITQTSTLEADWAKIGYLSSVFFSTGIGNPTSAYDLNKFTTYTSTSYNSISSLTNNILNYQLNIGIQDEPFYNMGGQGAGTPPARYNVLPANVEQWASTMIICNPTNGDAATLGLSYYSNWTTGSVQSGTFDLVVDMTKGGFFFNCSEASNANNSGLSTILSFPPTLGLSNTYRFTLQPSGWWNYITPMPPPYTTTNSNSFTISQDINDVFIKTTDRLNIQAGDTFFTGVTHIPNLQVNTLDMNNITTGFLSTLSTASFMDNAFFNQEIYTRSTIYGNDTINIQTFYDTLTQPSLKIINNPTFLLPSALSTPVNKYVALEANFSTIIESPILYLTPGTNNDMSLQKLGVWQLNGNTQATNYALGTFILTPIDNTFKIYTDNAGFGLASNLVAVNLSNASASYFMSLYINFPSAAINIPANSAVSLYWNGGTGLWSQQTYAPIVMPTYNSQVKLIQDRNSCIIQTPPTATLSTSVLQLNQINYGNPSSGFYQPKMFRQIISGSFGAGGSDSGTTQVSNGSMSFNASLYNCQCSIASFFCGNGTVAFNSVILAPYVDSGTNTWYVNWSIELNAGAAGASWTISWNAFMFPYNMCSS